MKKITALATATLVALTLAGCADAADTASHNLSKDADNFRIERRIVFLNGITDQYLLTIEGRCSIADSNGQLEVTCKTGEDAYKKHFLGLSDNVTYFAEQTEAADVSEYHYKVMFRPETLVPTVDLETSGDIEGDGR